MKCLLFQGGMRNRTAGGHCPSSNGRAISLRNLFRVIEHDALLLKNYKLGRRGRSLERGGKVSRITLSSRKDPSIAGVCGSKVNVKGVIRGCSWGIRRNVFNKKSFTNGVQLPRASAPITTHTNG